jgi:hypothetical protein
MKYSKLTTFNKRILTLNFNFTDLKIMTETEREYLKEKRRLLFLNYHEAKEKGNSECETNFARSESNGRFFSSPNYFFFC